MKNMLVCPKKGISPPERGHCPHDLSRWSFLGDLSGEGLKGPEQKPQEVYTGLGWGREGATLCFAPPIPPILLPIEPQNTQNPQPRDLRGGGSALWQGQRSEVQLSHPTAASCPCPASDLRSRECKGVGRRGEQCDGVREESGCPRRCRGLQHPSEQGSRRVQKGEGRSCEWVCVRERT